MTPLENLRRAARAAGFRHRYCYNPGGDRGRARQILFQATRSGATRRPARCQVCRRYRSHPEVRAAQGFHAQGIQADHPDYRFPLRVLWVCIPCHRLVEYQRAHEAGGPQGVFYVTALARARPCQRAGLARVPARPSASPPGGTAC
jgi:hypothetical protein